MLLNDVFQRYAGGRARCFDFEAPELREVAGVTSFYGSFGAVAAPFWSITFDRLPWPVRALRAARAALYRRLRPRPAA